VVLRGRMTAGQTASVMCRRQIVGSVASAAWEDVRSFHHRRSPSERASGADTWRRARSAGLVRSRRAAGGPQPVGVP
jgi:hypothetical protein